MDTRPQRPSALRILGAALAAALLAFGPHRPAGATAGDVSVVAAAPQRVALAVGESRLLRAERPVVRVSVSDEKVADALVLSPTQVYVVARGAGRTSLTIWTGEDAVAALLEIEVAPDVARLKEKLHEILPGEPVEVGTTHDRITLRGTVSSAPALARVLAVAEPFAPGRLVNLLEVGGVQQVMLEVRVAELSKDAARRMGINLAYVAQDASRIGLTLLDQLIFPTADKVLGTQYDLSKNTNAIYHFGGGGDNLTLFIDALKKNGLANVLAEPNLITLSGQRASFLAGGELPVPVPSRDGIGIEWKRFGVELTFTPTVLDNGRIAVALHPKVSEPDFSNPLNIAGYVVPRLLSREVDTSIELGDGQSFAIAGLLKSDSREVVSKFPVLGDLPILGALFRSSQFQKGQSELVVIATPRLVKPLPPGERALPGDAYLEPDDFEFFLLGALEGRPPRPAPAPPPPPGGPARAPAKGGLEGRFGHIIPD